MSPAALFVPMLGLPAIPISSVSFAEVIYIYIYIFIYIECNPTCLTCNGTGSDDCLTCKSSFKFCEVDSIHNKGKCITSCQTDCQINSRNSYLDISDDTCYECDLNCKKCSGGTSSNCTECYVTKRVCPLLIGGNVGTCSNQDCISCQIQTKNSYPNGIICSGTYIYIYIK